MASISANSYAEALFALGLEEQKLTLYKEQLSVIEKTLEENLDFVKVLNHPKITKLEKKTLLESIYGNEIDRSVLNFMKLLIDKGRFSLFSQIVKAFMKAYNKEHGIAVAFVKTAEVLDDKQCADIKALLETKLSKKVELQVVVDPSLLAGIRVKVDDLVIDNSAKMRLQKLKESVKLSSER